MSTTRPPTNTPTELARERSRAAAERTLTTWIGACLSLIAFGAAFEQTANVPALVALLPIGLGITFLIVASALYRSEIRALEQPEGLAGPMLSPVRAAAIAVVCYGVLIFAALLVKVR